MEPSEDPKADQLYNSNIKGNAPIQPGQPQQTEQKIQNGGVDMDAERDKIFNEVMDSLSKDIDNIIGKVSGGDKSES